MTIAAHLLAAGDGWRVTDVICTAGPRDRPFEERHAEVSIAVVSAGSFQYRAAAGRALLAPGALLLGNAGSCFECGHEHGAGDRCLAFRFTPACFESVLAAVPGARRAGFDRASLPPLAAFAPLFAEAEAARDARDAAGFEELALRLAGGVAATLAGTPPAARAPTAGEARRITAALRRIEAAADAPLPLAALAAEAAMSPYHFIRTFRRVAGMTPHQFVLRTRMHRAATRLRGGGGSVTDIALAAGFNDISTFNRRFRQIMGMSPRAWRRRGADA